LRLVAAPLAFLADRPRVVDQFAVVGQHTRGDQFDAARLVVGAFRPEPTSLRRRLGAASNWSPGVLPDDGKLIDDTRPSARNASGRDETQGGMRRKAHAPLFVSPAVSSLRYAPEFACSLALRNR